MAGRSEGGSTTDLLRIGGEDTADEITITEPVRGESRPVEEPRECLSSRLCFLTVESARSPITPSGACRQDGSTSRVECGYFGPQATSGLQSRRAIIQLGRGIDTLRIIQRAVRQEPAETNSWRWEIDYGAGNETIDPAILSVPEGSICCGSIKVDGGPGLDTFRGQWARGVELLGGEQNDTFDRVDDGDGRGPDIDGGSGADIITTGAFGGTLDGGPGGDRFVLSRLRFGASVDGGTGIDRAIYLDAEAPVTVHLDGSERSTGAATLRNIENASGSRFGDSIFGTDRPNTLSGNGGRGDVLIGRGGDDTLFVNDSTPPLLLAFQTDDTAEGGRGRDVIRANDGVRDQINCGTSNHPETFVRNGRRVELQVPDPDTAFVDLRDARRECENIRSEAVRTPPAARIVRTRLTGDRLRVVLQCPRSAPGGSCRGRARAGGARVRYRVPAGRHKAVRVRLGRSVRRRLARRGWAVVRVEVAERDARGRPRSRQRSVFLRDRRVLRPRS